VEEEEVVVKEECVSAAVEIHSCSSESDSEEEVMPTFPTTQELNKLKETNYVVPNVNTDEVEETEEEEVEVEVEDENDANSVESENDMRAEKEVAQDEDEDEKEEEEEEELFEVQINGVMYVSNDDEDGTIYSYVNEEVGDEIGKFIGKVAHIYSGGNKGVYNRTKCNFNI